MHGRIVTFSVPSGRLDQMVAGIKEQTQNLPDHPGFQHGHWLYDRENSRITAVVVFDSREQADAAWEKNRPRIMERMQEMGVTPEARSVEVVHEV